MNLIENIEKLVNESEESASKTLEKIKKAIQNSKAPDFSQIKDGEHFFYRGIEFIRLGLEQNGVLCMTAKPYYKEAFDTDDYGDWKESSARKKLNTEFLALLREYMGNDAAEYYENRIKSILNVVDEAKEMLIVLDPTENIGETVRDILSEVEYE